MNKKNNLKKLIFPAVVLAAVALLLIFTRNQSPSDAISGGVREVKDSDIVIPTSSVTEQAAFYPAIMNGTRLEVIAVKAPDGTIRTAFNTCQVCYGSGRGFYVQEGDRLVCQNCGNRFSMSDVEVTRGGCNPVPITDEYKTVDNQNIIISKDYLAQAAVIFQNRK